MAFARRDGVDSLLVDQALVAVSLAVSVEAVPDQSKSAVVYQSSPATLARRIKSLGIDAVSHGTLPDGDHYWDICIKVGSHRRTRYRVLLRESPDEVEEIRASRLRAAQLKQSLPHNERKKKPWGIL